MHDSVNSRDILEPVRWRDLHAKPEQIASFLGIVFSLSIFASVLFGTAYFYTLRLSMQEIPLTPADFAMQSAVWVPFLMVSLPFFVAYKRFQEVFKQADNKSDDPANIDRREIRKTSSRIARYIATIFSAALGALSSLLEISNFLRDILAKFHYPAEYNDLIIPGSFFVLCICVFPAFLTRAISKPNRAVISWSFSLAVAFIVGALVSAGSFCAAYDIRNTPLSAIKLGDAPAIEAQVLKSFERGIIVRQNNEVSFQSWDEVKSISYMTAKR